jgi:flagellin
MSLSFQTNVTALVAETNLQVNSQFQSNTITQLTSGYRINNSGDDAGGLAVANGLRSSITELTQGVRNANDGTNTLQTIDGGLNNISNILDQLQSLATQSASGTFNGNRATLNSQFTTLLGEIDRQAANIGLASGGANNASISVYIGGGSTQANSQVTVDLSGSGNVVDSNGLGLDTHAVSPATTDTIDTAANALNAITDITAAVQTLGKVQGAVGTGENDLNYAISLAQSQITNDSASESSIRDANIAQEAANLTQSQVLEQSSVSALAQADAAPQALLKLLQ